MAYTADCILNYEATTKYLFLIDIDEFLFVPTNQSTKILNILDSIQSKHIIYRIETTWVREAKNDACFRNNSIYLNNFCKKQNDIDHSHCKYFIKPNENNYITLFAHIHHANDLQGHGTYNIPANVLTLLHLRKTRAGGPYDERSMIFFNWTTQHNANVLIESILSRNIEISIFYRHFLNKKN